MIWDNIKRKIVERNIAKGLSTSKKERVRSDLKVGSILILAGDYIDKKNFQILANELNVDQEHLKVIVFKDRIDKEFVLENEISSKDFGVFGTFKNKRIQALLSIPVDLLVNYVQENAYVNKLVLDSNANFKIGNVRKNNFLYHLMIDVDSLDFQGYTSEIIKYLKILNKI
jgi:hypothetical protein